MTPLQRAVTRVTAVMDARTRKPLVVRLEVGGQLLRIRPKGDRSWYTVTYQQIAVLGARNKAAELKAVRLAEKAARKKEKEYGGARKRR